MRSSDRVRCVLLVAAVLATALGCMTHQRDEMVEAREAYHDCVREHPESHERACAELQAEAVTRQQRYEDDARRRWGCHDPNTPGCDPLDRSSRSP